MPSYWQLLLLILPIFAIIGAGLGLRRVGWLTAEADSSLIKIVVNFFYPCLIFENVLANAALRDPSNLLLAPLVGFVTIAAGIGLSLWVGRSIGLSVGHGLRTFALAVGIYNYGYIPLPLMTSLFGKDSVGVLLVHNVGCEMAIWTVGILVLSGLSLREGWRKLINPSVISLIVSVTLNLLKLGPSIPKAVFDVAHLCGVCAVPIALLLIGATLNDYCAKPAALLDGKVGVLSCGLRLLALPVAFLVFARFLPCPVELKRVMIVQAAMPAGVFSIVIAKHYGGQPLTAVRVVVATTAVGLLVIPLWLKAGLAWIFGTAGG